MSERDDAIAAAERAKERGDTRGYHEACKRAKEATHAVLRAGPRKGLEWGWLNRLARSTKGWANL